jgi:hypothetical protein
MSTTYEYIPITAPGTIRLLELHPGKGSDPVEVSLITTPLSDAPSFETISYCWGDASDRREVLCNGCLLSITASLFTGLEHFRPRPLSHSDSASDSARYRVLWADAICINQSDMAERSAQIHLMPSIYSLARRVLIWLGPLSPPYSGAAVRSCIHELDAAVPAVNEIDADDLDAKAQALWRDANFLSKDILPLVSLLARPWFRRKWVVQEVSLAKEAVMCVGRIGETAGEGEMGDEEIPWMEVTALTFRFEGLGAERFIRRRIQQCVPRNELLSPSLVNLSIHCLNSIYLVSLYRGRGTLMDAITVTAAAECSVPHDIIYSLLGLSFTGPTMTPDYTADFGDVFWQFALAMVVEGASLKVLSLAPQTLLPYKPAIKRPEGLPSWVPDLRGPRADSLIAYSVLPQAFFAGGHAKPIVCVSENRKVLSCQGRLIDTAKGFAAGWSDMFHYDPELAYQGLTAWLQGCYRFVLSQNNGDNASAEMMKAFSRTMVCDIDPMRNRLSPESAASLPSHIQRLMDHVEQENRNSEIDDSWSAWEDAATPHSVIATMSFRCWAKVLKFGVTNGGRFMRAPQAARAGDRICVLIGGEVPFIIRSTGRETYELVGECYVDGIMDGEALEMGSGATAEYETIRLE